jgi:hypothetical protein
MNKINPNHTHFEILKKIHDISFNFIDEILQKQENLIFAEPYIPYIPDQWNGLLVLSESQNLASHQNYIDFLSKLNSSEKIQRLYNSKNNLSLGVGPWDDGSLALAVEAALDLSYHKTAVSNAVLWSKGGPINQNPSRHMIYRSIDYYKTIFETLKPIQILSIGKQAEYIANKSINLIKNIKCNIIYLQHPSPRNQWRLYQKLNTIPNLKNLTAENLIEQDTKIQEIFKNYKEIKEAIYKKSHKNTTKNKILYSYYSINELKTNSLNI